MKTPVLPILICGLLLAGCQAQTLQDVPAHEITMADSVNVVYKTVGNGNPALVFIHGFGCDMNAWEAQYAYFKDKARLVFIDIPGYGKSDRPHTEYTLDFYADATAAVLQALDVQKAVLIGHSLGTAICRQVVYQYPRLASKLVDVDGVYCFFPEDSLLRANLETQYAAFVAMFAGEDMKSAMEAFIQPLFCEQTPQSVKDYALSTMPNTPQYVAYSTMKHLVEKPYWTKAPITIPSLIIAAKNSQIPPDYEAIMQRLYTQMHYEELADIGHFIMMEQPDLFNALLDTFRAQ